MKRNFRYIVFLTCLVFATLGTCLSPNSVAAPARGVPDPACVSECQLVLYNCFANGTKKNENACISTYRHCIAQCGKH